MSSAADRKLQLSPKLSLPVDAITQKFAVLGRSGSGKSYAAGKLAEEMLEVGGQVVVLDPVGVWYGLRLGADGKSRGGYPIPVLGGLHGDVPLEAGMGAAVARLLVQKRLSLVVDVSMFRKADRKRFATDFAEELFHQEKAARSPLHLIVEEAQVFVPQRAVGDDARMLGAFEDVIKLGRNFGIGSTLISQRPQSVNKDALNQAECLIVLQTNGVQERKALRDWVVEQGLAVDLLKELPGLDVGTAWVWSPQWLHLLKKVRIGTKRTFNASATPVFGGGKAAVPIVLAPVDLRELESALRKSSEPAPSSGSGSVALHRRIRELEEELARVKRTPPEVRERKVLLADELVRLEAAARTILQRLEEVRAAQSSPAPVSSPGHVVTVKRPLAVKREPAAIVAGGLPKGARNMLMALAGTHLPALTRRQVALLSKLKVSSGTFSKYLSLLRTGGLVEEGPSGLSLSPSGLAAVGGKRNEPRSSGELIGEWKARLPGKTKEMLEVLVQSHPQTVSRDELASAVGLEVSSGTFSKYLSLLSSNGLAVKRGGQLAASDSLFLGG